MTYLSADNLTKIQHFPGLGEMMWKWVMKGELVENVTVLVIRCYKDFGSPGMGFLDFGILITGILTHLKVISSKWSLFYHRINVFSPCEDSGEVSRAELCHNAWRTSYVPDSLANADWLECLAWATPSEVMLGIFLGINDYFHCQDIFHQVQLPPVRNYGQGKAKWSVVNVYVWTWEFMFCGPAKLIKLQN